MLILYHAGRYFMPRKRLSILLVLVFLATGLVVLAVLPAQVRFFTSVAFAALGNKRTSEQLESMIPLDTQGKALFPRTPHGSENVSSPFSDIQCKTQYPKVTFFMRIPKCASTSFADLLRALSKQGHNFEFYFHSSGAYGWDTLRMRKVADLARAKKSRFVYARHFYYVDFSRFNLMGYTYVTVVRDPVSRFKSSFLYYHYSSRKHIQAMLDPRHSNESLMTCIEHRHEGCEPNLMTKYFCGHERFCKLGNEQALSYAKENLQKDFTVVLVLEELELSFKVLRKMLPRYFDGIESSQFELSSINKNDNSAVLSEEEAQAVKKANEADLELYNYAKELLHQQVKACSLAT